MKRFISLITTVAILITACLPLSVSAELKIDKTNNTFSVDFEGSNDGRWTPDPQNAPSYPEACVKPSGDSDYALRMMAVYSDGAWETTTQWNSTVPSNDVNDTIVNGEKIQLNFGLRVDGTSTTNVKTGVCQIKSVMSDGTVPSGMTQFLLQLQYTNSKWYINVFNNSGWKYKQLCEIKADIWQDVVLVLDLEKGTYDAYSNGYELHNIPLVDESWNLMNGMTNLMDIQFKNNKHAQTANTSATIDSFTYYIDDLSAKAVTETVIDFEDESSAFGEGRIRTLSSSSPVNSAAVVTAVDKNGYTTKALQISYDGLNRVNSTDAPNTVSDWRRSLDTSKTMLVSGTKAAVGFDFMIDGCYTDTTTTREGLPAMMFINTGDGKELTYLVAARYNREKNNYDILFTDGRKQYVESGISVSTDEWASVDMTIDLKGGTYDAYVNGAPVLKNLKLGDVATKDTYITSAADIKDIMFIATKTEHYNGNTWSKWRVYIDNVTYDEWESKDITSSDAKLVDSAGNEATDGNAVKYSVTINNPNTVGDYVYFAMRALDEDNVMQDIVFKKYFIPTGTTVLTEELTRLNEGEKYDVKAFFLDMGFNPYNIERFPAVHVPIAENNN